MMPNFWQLATTPILKIQEFPLGMLILRQKFSNFVPPAWKLDNPYYHNDKKEQGRNILKHFCDTQKKVFVTEQEDSVTESLESKW